MTDMADMTNEELHVFAFATTAAAIEATASAIKRLVEAVQRAAVAQQHADAAHDAALTHAQRTHDAILETRRRLKCAEEALVLFVREGAHRDGATP